MRVLREDLDKLLRPVSPGGGGLPSSVLAAKREEIESLGLELQAERGRRELANLHEQDAEVERERNREEVFLGNYGRRPRIGFQQLTPQTAFLDHSHIQGRVSSFAICSYDERGGAVAAGNGNNLTSFMERTNRSISPRSESHGLAEDSPGQCWRIASPRCR